MDNIRYVVAIAVPTTDGKHEVGTGCSVSDDLVLTARHVVFPKKRKSDKLIIVYFGAVHGAGVKDCVKVELAQDCIAWDGGKSLDAVLLRCPRPNDWKGLSVSWVPTMESRKWSSRGYPRAVRVEASPLVPAGFDGVLDPTIKKDGFAESTVTAYPPKVDGWKGASGMPLFCFNSGGILGLAYEVAQGFEGKKIRVAPSWKLFENEQFKALIQKDDEAFQKFCAEMQQWLATILFENQSVALALAKCYGVNKSNPQERAAEIAEKIVQSPPDDFLTHLYKIQYGEPGMPGLTGDVELQTIADIMHVALPILNDPNVRQAAQEASSSMVSIVVELGIATRTVAEIAMALAERKETSFTRVPVEERQVPGMFALEQLPVAGRDHGCIQANLDLIKTLGSLLGNRTSAFDAEFRKFLDETCITGDDRDAFRGALPEERMNQIKAILELELANKGRRYYYVAMLPKEALQREAALETLKVLRKGFAPYIVFLVLTNDLATRTRETRTYGNVSEIRRITS
ncbi:MAG: hypothetical protein HQL74_14570 [Magnetococcales bacterium]|nr:hypothetical protein [Magnetococcales bacterium]